MRKRFEKQTSGQKQTHDNKISGHSTIDPPSDDSPSHDDQLQLNNSRNTQLLNVDIDVDAQRYDEDRILHNEIIFGATTQYRFS